MAKCFSAGDNEEGIERKPTQLMDLSGRDHKAGSARFMQSLVWRMYAASIIDDYPPYRTNHAP